VNSWMAGAVSPWEAEMQTGEPANFHVDTAKSAPAVVVEEPRQPRRSSIPNADSSARAAADRGASCGSINARTSFR